MRFFSDNCLLSNAFAVHVLTSAPRECEKLNHRVLDCAFTAEGTALAALWGDGSPVSDLLSFPSSEMGYFLCSEEYICVDETICPFLSVEKMLTCTSCHNSWLDPKVCYFKPSHLVMYCSPSRRYSADAVSAKKESCVLGSSPSAKSSMLSSSCAVSEDYKVKNEAWLICIS